MKLLKESALFSVLLTVGAYEVGRRIQRKTKCPAANPLLIAIVIVIAALWALDIGNADYEKNVSPLSFLLTPATVCFALPLYRQLQPLRKSLRSVLCGVTAGSIAGMGSVYLMCRLFSLPRYLSVSLLPKSVSTAFGILLSEQADGLPSLTAIAIAITGILGNLLGEAMIKLFHITDEVASGVALGTASHVIGTTKAAEINALSGAAGSLSLVIAGIITATLFPVAVLWI